MADSIVVVHSFRYDGNIERGKTYWFSTEEKANQYLVRAGQRTPEGCYYDDPCEHRWDHVVVERVFEGVGRISEVMSWWVARYEGGRLDRIVRTWTPPFDIGGSFNFTGVGT